MSTIVVQDNLRYTPPPPSRKEVSFGEHHSYPDMLYATKYKAESSAGKNYFQQQITPQIRHWIGQQQEVDSPAGFHHPPPPPPSYFMVDKWDPYDSEPDILINFRFEGNGYLMTPAGSLSFLSSTHFVTDNNKYV